jgi:thiaminase (transcriptional activator TenA)
LSTAAASLTDRMRSAAQPIWDQQFQHPFVKALGDGSLPQEVFQFYICQDARFLDHLAKSFAFAVTRSDDQDEMQAFGERLLHTLAVEKVLHHQFAVRFGLTVDQMMATPMAPTNYAYTRHLLHIAATDSLAALLTSLLPCAWIYSEVGRLFTSGTGGLPGPGHAYADWIGTYASVEFEQVGAWLRERLNRKTEGLPESELQRLEAIFLTSSRYEYMFWDMAWRRERWPV